MATINDVAKAAGVTPTTVSRAFTGREYINPETKKKILKIAKKINYTPRVVKHHKKTIGLIYPEKELKRLLNVPINYLMHIIHKLNINGYKTNIITSNMADNILTEHFKGIISVATGEEEMQAFKKDIELPVIHIGPNIFVKEKNHCVIVTDIESDIKNIIEYFNKYKHTNIGFVFHILDTPYWPLKSIEKICKGHNIELIEGINLFDISKMSPAQIIMQAKKNKITGMFIASSTYVIDFISHINSLELNIPDDISIVGREVIHNPETVHNFFSSLNIDYSEITEKCLLLLEDIINKKAPSQKVIKVPSTLIEGSSVRVLPD